MDRNYALEYRVKKQREDQVRENVREMEGHRPMTDKATDVTQADRDAAADFLKSDGHPFDRLWHPAVRRGERDNHILVQAFARHRTASEQPASGEGRSNGAGEIEQAARAIQAKYQETHDDTFLPIEVCREYALASLSAPQGEVERLRRAALTDDPDWICAGVPDHAIEAGIEAWKAAESDMELRARCENPEDVTDWDEGMIVAAIFKAIGTALAKVKGAPDAR